MFPYFGSSEPRHKISKLGSRCHLITEVESKKSYLLIVQNIKDSHYNYQAVLAQVGDTSPDDAKFFAIERELYNLKFFAKSSKIRTSFVANLIDSLLRDDIENPIQVAHMLGGQVHSEQVLMPPPPLQFYH